MIFMDKLFMDFSEDTEGMLGKENEELVRAACEAALRFEQFEGNAEISFTVTDDEKIKELNRIYRDKDSSTDVLSFPLGENGEYDKDPSNGAYMLGDIVISLEHAKAQAAEYGHSLKREIAFLTVHSVLHLLGYDHEHNECEEQIMFRKQREILNGMGLAR